jgi:hypothetical protein
LGIPWLYSINANISIRQSSIKVGDPLNGEKFRTIVKPELVFSKDHNLFMYPKAIFTQAVTEKDDSEDSDSSENFSDVNED